MLLTFPLLTLAALSIVYLLVSGSYEVEYIAEVTSNSMPLYLRVTALWGGQEGSLLFWCWLLSGFSFIALVRQWNQKFAAIPGARAFAFGPPPLPGYGNVSGFSMQLQDRSGGSIESLASYVKQLTKAASERPEIGRLSTTFSPTTPQVRVDLDREKARTLGVPVNEVFQALSTALGGSYVNDEIEISKVK